MFRSSRVSSRHVLAVAAALSLASISPGAAAQVPPGGDPTGAGSATNTTSTGGGTSSSGDGTTTDPAGSAGGGSAGATSGGATATGPGDLSSGDPTSSGPPWTGPTDLTGLPGMHPCDRPPPGILTPVDCSTAQVMIVNEAIDEAGYIVWRSRQLLDRVLDAPTPADAEALWTAGFGGYQVNGSSLQNWFGDYHPHWAELIKEAFDDIWKKYLGPGAEGKEVHCGCTAAMDANASAHHWIYTGPRLCSGFFSNRDPLERGALLVHELLHWTSVGGFVIDDSHAGFGCEWNDGLQKCYDDEECLVLAQQSTWDAVHNNSNYEYFGFFWAKRYLDGACTDWSVCSSTDLSAPACPRPGPTPPEYSTCNLDTGEGCPCTDVNDLDTPNDGGFADGEGSFLQGGPLGQFCAGANMVCGKIEKDGIDYPICKTCTGEGEIGCPCDNDEECGGTLYCAGWTAPGGYNPVGAGTCLPLDDPDRMEEVPWFCVDNCAALDPYGEGSAACIYNQLGHSFSHGTCVSLIGACLNNPGDCESTGKVCRLDDDDDDVCVEECDEKRWDCAELGFPDTFVCDALGAQGFTPGNCVPPACVDSTSEYCNRYR